MRMKFDESDNVVVRGARSFTDTVSERLSGMFEDDESNVVLQEIAKQDPTFDKTRFALHCEKNVIPAVLEVCWVCGWALEMLQRSQSRSASKRKRTSTCQQEKA